MRIEHAKRAMLLDFDFLGQINVMPYTRTFFVAVCPPKESVSGRSLSSCLSRPDPVVA